MIIIHYYALSESFAHADDGDKRESNPNGNHHNNCALLIIIIVIVHWTGAQYYWACIFQMSLTANTVTFPFAKIITNNNNNYAISVLYPHSIGYYRLAQYRMVSPIWGILYNYDD